MSVPRYTPEGEFYRDADGVDLEQDSQWDIAGSDFLTDPSLDEWPRPRRSVWRPSPVCREDFDPAGLPSLGEAA